MQKRFVLHNVKHLNGENLDIVVEDGMIADLTRSGSGQGNQIFDYSGAYVSSGWIDLHTHAFPDFDPYGDEIDEIGIKQGVTTIVDAGSCGADRIADLAASRERAQTNLFAFLNISRIGLKRVDELSNMAWIDKEKAVQAANQYKDFIVGLKARISKSVVRDCGIEPLIAARALSHETSLPLMVHIGSGPPSIEDILSLLEKKDIITHYLNGKANNLFDKDGKPLQAFTEAIQRGVHLDVGHGTASFSFQVAEAAKQHHIGLDTISTDIYRGNRLNGPVYSMSHVLTKFLYLGYPLEEVIAAVTTHAANWLEKPELGRIQIGDVANLTLFTVENEPTTLVDSEGDKRIADQIIQAKGVVVNGSLIKC
ncbi:amidohydrolase/deacetylase family metallohydrolase [Paenibacillus alginolyticus]|uniref:Amidohydrolase/deacetylase family metallohydrolase n=1 Tax=Paenibacillus alginolyticus TaxID=59839 RepID=A0ABT4GBH6_9BACL|nr:amidohydrolase/deacetylase family metallohydrolase [Paenibacillus alginolyticus]MCY9664090.1 amidohydrolase/deacetylase family metallohydrolase [Paenibacillus alginolyticus]MCY9693542.1 amidohydrolase/deacetylase family metallohydrolase [Paenibacillus alginolyticus]MEC0144425.1 amidohydrolase/deacetylase family metallohydrolase [Paenibacillus alginolyticus]